MIDKQQIMTTKEKAKEFAYSEYNTRMGYYAEIGFNRGAEWMLNKICEWLRETLYEDVTIIEDGLYAETTRDELVDELRKAMEEE